jgi:hypothetical protein
MIDPRYQPEGPEEPLCSGDPLARALAKLAPATVDLVTPQLMFAAGQAKEQRATAFWKRLALGQSVIMSLAGVGLAVTFWLPTAPPYTRPPNPSMAETTKTEVAPMPREVEPSSSPWQEPTGFTLRLAEDEASLEERRKWLQIRNDILAGGVNMLPNPGPELRAPEQRWPGMGGDVFAIPPIRPTPPPQEEPLP